MKIRVNVARARRADAALRRQPERVVGHERRARPPAVPARAQPEQRAGQPADAGGARFPDDAHGDLLGPPRRGRASRTSRSTSAAGSRSSARATRRLPIVPAGAEVAVQQSQLLVSAEPGHRLRDGAHPHHRADGIQRRRIRHHRSRIAGRRAGGADRRLDARRSSARRIRSSRRNRFATSACVVSRMVRVDAATVALDIVAAEAAAARHARRRHAGAAVRCA